MKKVIVIAEDDHAIVEVMKIILEEAGYETITVENGERVIKLVTENLPNLLLLDIWLAGEDGGELAKQIKGNEKTKTIPIIMISANNETEKIAKDAGADGFLRKPFDINDLLDIVKNTIR